MTLKSKINTRAFIDFKALFDALYEAHEEELTFHQYEADHYRQLITFKEVFLTDGYVIDKPECELDEKIRFVFVLNEGDFTKHTEIVYCTILEEFISFETS